ncbi:MAG TPA: hypothetical protein VEZ88_09020 [Steroidobacteraceae bacterium]|nr:hypothetical protein [Steroidobacteraceae bacterium]
MQTWIRALAHVALLACALCAACTQPESRGASLLFRGGTGGLTVLEQKQIFDQLSLSVASDGQSFVDTVCGQPAEASVEFPDLNGDQVSEVVVIFGNSCTSGHAERSVLLFVRRDGKLRANLGFPGASVDALTSRNLGYADIRIGGPGWCFPVWRWNGSEYVGLRNEPQEPGGCDAISQ